MSRRGWWLRERGCRKAGVLPLLAALLVALLPAPAQALVEFSAKVIRSAGEDGERSVRGRMVVGSLGVRTEGVMNNQRVVMIFRPDRKTIWMVFPDQRTYMEQTEVEVGRPPLPDEPGSPCGQGGVTCRQVGEEQVNGRRTIHWEVAAKPPEGEEQVSHLWVDQRLKVAIRERYANGMTVEMVEIREARQNPKLFQLPRGYRRVEPQTAAQGAQGRP